MDPNIIAEWYRQRRGVCDTLAPRLQGVIEDLLFQAGVQHLSASYRVKSLDSLKEKVERKAYVDLQRQVTDLIGLRILTFVESEADSASNLMRKAFRVHTDRSPNKSMELPPNQVGYRSIHLVCDLGRARERLPEFKSAKGLLFEVQIRTILQHAWAEFEHARNYKFAGRLPSHLQRRLFLAAGLLEVADQELNRLAREVEEYSLEVFKEARSGDLDVELNSASLIEYLKVRHPEFTEIEYLSTTPTLAMITDELRIFDIATLSELDNLLSPEFLQAREKVLPSRLNALGTLREAMMYRDIQRYFDRAWRRSWQGFSSSSTHVLLPRYGLDTLKNYAEKYGISL